jgi:bla regulator protein BlaR1
MDTAIASDLLAIGFIKPILLLAVVLLLWILLRKKSAALQHFVLSLGFIGVLLLPLLASLVPAIPLRMESPWAILSGLFPDVHALGAWLESSLSSWQWLLLAACYLLPATSLLFYLLLGIVGLWRQQARAQEITDTALLAQVAALCELVDIRRPVTLLTSQEVDSPQTWGIFCPVILLPRAAVLWDEDKQLSVLIHELGHIARWDWLVTLLVKITCALFWFLLPIWWLAQQLYQQAEIACDDYIYKLRDKHLTYAQNLLAIAAAESYQPVDETALQMRGHSAIHQRILAVIDQQRPHHPVAVESAQYWVLIGGLVLVIMAGVQRMPLLTAKNSANHQPLFIQWKIQEDAACVAACIDDTARREEFSWELVQALKPVAAPDTFETVDLSNAFEPHDDLDRLEQLHIIAAKPDKTELVDIDERALKVHESVAIPRIQVEGFLPVKLVTPQYPATALSKGIEGWVEVEFTIDTRGAIVEPRIIGHSPSAVFDRSVLAALKKSSYRPQLFDGQPIVVQGVTEVFRFTLVHDNSSLAQTQNQFQAQPPAQAVRRR